MRQSGRAIQTLAASAVVIVSLSVPTLMARQTSNTEQMAADASVVRVETLELEPTVVKTGDVITQTYRLQFPDLISEGKEIIILEDRVAPENLPVHPFEAVSVEVDKRQVGDEYIWDFEYGLRLIAPEKAFYVLPGFSFYYLVRDLGEDVEDVEVEQVDAAGGLVRYVTTINDAPGLDIRDTIELGEFQTRATGFRILAWGVAPLPLLVWFVLLVRQARRPDTVSEDQQQEADELERLEAQIPRAPSIWQARRALLAGIRRLEDLAPGANGSASHDIQRTLLISGREFLQAEIRELHTGDTPKDVQKHIEGLAASARKDALLALAGRLVTYQHGLELDAPELIADPHGEARELAASIGQLRPHVRLLTRVKGLFGV
jgi:hypothetical protein